jgi:hypothetical protein
VELALVSQSFHDQDVFEGVVPIGGSRVSGRQRHVENKSMCFIE